MFSCAFHFQIIQMEINFGFWNHVTFIKQIIFSNKFYVNKEIYCYSVTSISRNNRLTLTNGSLLYHLDNFKTSESMIQHLREKHYSIKIIWKREMINVRLAVVNKVTKHRQPFVIWLNGWTINLIAVLSLTLFD